LTRSTCDHCGQHFIPKRRSARFCSDAHKMAWHRARTAHGMPPTAPQTAAGGLVSVPGTPDLPGGNSGNLGTLSHRPLKLPKGIVPDAKWPGMYRLVRSDGTLSDMVNLTRAKDALRQQQNETPPRQGRPAA